MSLFNITTLNRSSMPPRKLLAERTTMQVTWELKDRIAQYKRIIKRFKNQEMPQAESDQQVLERFVRIIDELAKIKSKKYKHEAEKYIELDEVLDRINIPSKMPRQTYYQVIQSKK